METRKVRVIGSALYVALACDFAATAKVSGDGHWYMAAILVTLPAGIPAVILVYIGYGIMSGLVHAALVSVGIGGDGWLSPVTGVMNVVLFGGAALTNLALFRALRHARAGTRSARRP